MARLREPERGCPWDLEQSFETIAPYTIEEAYEVAEAIRDGDLDGLRDELGDLLFQVVFYAQMAAERGAWRFADVVAGICDKMVRRHPHVFGDAEVVKGVATAAAQTEAWEHHKAAERAARRKSDPSDPTASGGRESTLDGVPLALPALSRAHKLQSRAARVGFDWPAAAQVLDKIDEEVAELRDEIDHGGGPERINDELGDILFAQANLARHLGVDPETALRHANAKFERRFRKIEAWLAEDGRSPAAASLAEMEALWTRAKAEEAAA